MIPMAWEANHFVARGSGFVVGGDGGGDGGGVASDVPAVARRSASLDVSFFFLWGRSAAVVLVAASGRSGADVVAFNSLGSSLVGTGAAGVALSVILSAV